ncbi:hypothetical protein ABG067_004889 [Albugo candida]|uniref:Early meiotic induction protein 1 n=1 Tax=Albugo candida TaxID=65357 RepID=A0A024G0S8_9STRA|nr:unnamed protein product [Albugo candida]|eukprot:CCI40364.1 unnamed protein product [Albugo candida]
MESEPSTIVPVEVKTNENVKVSSDSTFRRPYCKWFLDRAFYCVSPINQLTQYYRRGELDSCKGTWNNIYHCFRSSLMEEERAKEYLKITDIDPNKPQPTANVWELKQKPGWD